MIKKLKVGIICGGPSEEHEISLKSALTIIEFIDKNRFEIFILWISKKGDWYFLDKKDFFCFIDKNRAECFSFVLKNHFNQFNFYLNNLLKLDIIFPIIHGTLGEDGSLQGFLNVMKLPYVGSDVLGSAICMNKDVTKNLLYCAGLPIIPFRTFASNKQTMINFYDLVHLFGLPLCVKPVNQGSSIGVSKIDNLNDFHIALDIAFSFSNRIMIEPFILGRELECAVLGGNYPKASLCGEIVIKNNNFYTYQDKYKKNISKIIIPAALDKKDSFNIRKIAIQAFKVLSCFGMARVDVFLTKRNQVFINEVNTLPGFTETSMFPKLWKATGLDFKKLLTDLIELALRRHYYND